MVGGKVVLLTFSVLESFTELNRWKFELATNGFFPVRGLFLPRE